MADAPTPLVSTVVQQPAAPTNLEVASFSVKDISILLGMVVALTIIAGFFLNRASAKRKEDRDDAQDRTQRIMDAVAKSHDDSARDVRELSDKVKDGRTVVEKDIETVRTGLRHEKGAREQASVATAHLFEKTNEEITKLRDRMTAAETNGKHTTDTLAKLELTFTKQIEETKALIKAQGDTATAQFRELATSIRETRDVKPKP